MGKMFLVCFYGGAADPDPLVRVVAAAQQASLRANMARAVACGRFARRILVSAAADLLTDPPPDCEVMLSSELTPDGWHFGRALRAIAVRLAEDDPTATLFYFGGGAAPLLSVPDFVTLCDIAPDAPVFLAANNYFSADLALVRPLSLLTDPRTLTIGSDNDLIYRLDHDWPGLHERRHYAPLTMSAAAFDIDTPLDAVLFLLAMRREKLDGSDVGARFLEQFVAHQPHLEPLVARVEGILPVLRDPRRTLLLAGRLNATTLRMVEERARCQTRTISEERGMRASGRLERGEVRSLLGTLYDSVGAEAFFNHLRAICDVVILDSRVLFAHLHRQPDAADRFHSDLLDPAPIRDPVIRAFTRAAADAGFPVLLGGHSAVAGGLRLMLEML